MKLTDEEFEKVFAEVAAKNPGTELWEGGHKVTGDRWIYRAATGPETRIYRKTQRQESEKGVLRDMDIPDAVIVRACVIWPEKEGLDQLIAMRPMLMSVIAGEICEVSGATAEAIQKKLS